MSARKNHESDPIASIRALEPIQCGEDAAKHFYFDEGYRNLDHGAYGTYPIEVGEVFRYYQARSEARPDIFVRYEYRTHLLDESRQTIARYLNAPLETCVYVANATTGIETVLRNLKFDRGDVVVAFSSLYPAFENTMQYLSETSPVELEKIEITQPVSDQYVCEAFEATIEKLRAKRKIPRIAIFDTINTLPGVRMPFERLIELCRSYNILSCVDGAHGVGHITLDLPKLDPDFFVSNCHKWLYVPRSCAVFYVPTRNQHLMRATLPTGYGFTPRSARKEVHQTVPKGFKTEFEKNFADAGTRDDTPYLCVAAALEWRTKLEWGGKRGEEAIMAYCHELARKGGRVVSTFLGTEVLENEDESLGRCSVTNVRLPLSVNDLTKGDSSRAEQIGGWMTKTMALEYQTALNVFLHGDVLWARLHAQVYLTLEDFEAAARDLKTVCEAAIKGDWRASN